ncbi:MAG: DUF1571 domain-containing protein [Candidatus Ancaeobacter aquaticus]|nr:DUF1571 domain-containing protein [Candidatus Ancaeobacter aquaticus]
MLMHFISRLCIVPITWAAVCFCIIPASISADTADPCEQIEVIIQDAHQAYNAVDDYTATLLRTECIKNRLRSKETIELKFAKPDSVYLKWLTSPNPGLLNQHTEIIYPVGKNKDKVIAHLGGLINFITPTITVTPDDSSLMKDNRHPVTHTGIGFFLNLFRDEYKKALQDSTFTQKYYGTVRLMGTHAHKIEFIMPDKNKGYYCHRLELYFDVQNKLPIRIIAYNWKNQLIERYSFFNLKLNVGLNKEDFNPWKKEYNF